MKTILIASLISFNAHAILKKAPTRGQCMSIGFDCVLEKRCVKDGTLKSNAQNRPEYDEAIADVSIHPENFVDWPRVYNVCPSPY